MTGVRMTSDEQNAVERLMRGCTGDWGYDQYTNTLESLFAFTHDDVESQRRDQCKRLVTVLAISRRCLRDGPAMRALADAWQIDNTPQKGVSAALWLEAFEVLKGASDPCDDPELSWPTEQKKLWRGSEPKYRCNLAWTGSKAIAERFVGENGGLAVRTVYSAVVEPWRVKGRYNRECEDEYVIDTRGLVMSASGADGGLDPCRLKDE